MKDLEGKHVTVLGLGASGRAAIKLALARGADVLAVDSSNQVTGLQEDPQFNGMDFSRIKVKLGAKDDLSFCDTDHVVVSPGVSLEKFNLQQIIHLGKPVCSEIQFAAEVLPKAVQVAAISGTNGKSTVTTFTGQILQHAGVPAFVGGNLGSPLSEAALQVLNSFPKDPPFQVVVLEVSSYQMEIPGHNLRPSVAVVLNLTPDHMERHKNLRNYGACKCRLFSQMSPSDVAIIPRNDKLLEELACEAGGQGSRAWLGGIPGVKIDNKAQIADLLVTTTGLEAKLDLGVLNTVGVHNAHNAGIAAFLAFALDVGLDKDTVQSALPTLVPPPHRMQAVCEDDNGILWVNDSKATNVDATYIGLKGFRKHKAIVLLGGLPKVLNDDGEIGFQRLVEVLETHRAVITFGVARERIHKDLKAAGLSIPCIQSLNMVEATSMAKSIARKGDAILLSPGCASFDEFKNFEHRGSVFNLLAKGLYGCL